MDLEPGRCKRTDGKKWRCRKDVILDQKYCENHIHRGCRSRKLVEISLNVSQPKTTAPVNFGNAAASASASAATSSGVAAKSNGGVGGVSTGYVGTGYEFSPKSVLHEGCNSSTFILKTGTETEPERCKRTDGKKWRCKRSTVPDQKYCEMHVNRGAKKLVLASKTTLSPLSKPEKVDESTRLKTNILFSMQGTTSGGPCGGGGGGSSSDATTVTDEYIPVNLTSLADLF